MAINIKRKNIKNLLMYFSLELCLFLVSRLFNDNFVFWPKIVNFLIV